MRFRLTARNFIEVPESFPTRFAGSFGGRLSLDSIFNFDFHIRNRSHSIQLRCFTSLAHLSRRLIGELIVYQWSVVRPQCSNIFFSETAWPIKAKFYVEPPWVGGTIFCSRHLGHMTKMAATPIYGKNPSKIFSRTGRPIFTKLVM